MLSWLYNATLSESRNGQTLWLSLTPTSMKYTYCGLLHCDRKTKRVEGFLNIKYRSMEEIKLLDFKFRTIVPINSFTKCKRG
jgi:hypothetical protein